MAQAQRLALALCLLLGSTGVVLAQDKDKKAEEAKRFEEAAKKAAEAREAAAKAAADAEMRRRIQIQMLQQLAQPPGAVAQPKGGAPVKQLSPAQEDEKTLRDVGVGTDVAGVLDFFRKRTLPEANPKKLAALIRQLGDDDFRTREKAFAELATLGAAAIAALKQAENDADAEVRQRVIDLKQRIEAKAEPSIQTAAVRHLGRQKPAGAAEVLLAYLPFATEQSVIDEIGKALGALAVRDGKTDPALVRALGDAKAIKRAAAAEGIIRSGAADQLPAARKLLEDSDPAVRLRVAMALVPRKEKAIVPVIIDLLAELPADQLWSAEEVLVRLAGDKAPAVSIGGTEASRKAARDAWRGWYEQNKDKVDLARLEQPDTLLGYTVVVQQNFNRIIGGVRRSGGEVMELKADKSVRWKFEVTTYPVDAQVVAENRVLVAEYQGGQVSERDFNGKILWSVQCGGNPIGVQGMPNGNVFVVLQNRLVEYDRERREVFSSLRPQHDLVRAKKLRNGDVVFLTNNGQFTRMDAKGQLVKSFNVTPLHTPFGNMDVLPDGHLLVPDFQRHRVVEYDAEGREKKAINVQWPNAALRLPNGNILVTSQNTRRVVEFNRDGQEVWAYQAEGNVFNARRR